MLLWLYGFYVLTKAPAWMAGSLDYSDSHAVVQWTMILGVLIMLFPTTIGFTPMMKLIRHHLSANPHKKCKLIFFNRTANDIYYKQQLDELTALHQK